MSAKRRPVSLSSEWKITRNPIPWRAKRERFLAVSRVRARRPCLWGSTESRGVVFHLDPPSDRDVRVQVVRGVDVAHDAWGDRGKAPSQARENRYDPIIERYPS